MVLAIVFAGLVQGKPPAGPPVGRYNGEIRDKDGVMMRVAMQTPPKPVPGQKPSLLLVHHGMNGSENNYIQGTLDGLKRLNLDNEFVVISGKSKGAGWTNEDDAIVLRVIAWAKESYNVDPRRVYIWGSSNGAGFVGRFGWANQDKIAAVVGYCGGYNFSGAPPQNPAETRTEWYFVHGGNDNPQNSGNACQALKKMGYHYVFRQLDGYGHTDIWDGAGHPDMTWVDAVRDDYMLWLHGLRHKEMAPTEKEQKWLAGFENKSKAESMLGSKPTYLELGRIGGPLAGAAIAQGLQSKNAGIRASAAEACLSVSYGPVAAAELAKLVSDESDRAQQAALRALGVYANWHYPEAQAALCQVAAPAPAPAADGKPAAKPNAMERVIAVESTGKAVRLALLGNFEDKQLFWTLVQCLDDDVQGVRAAAFTALTPWTKDGFGYRPEMPPAARKAAVDKWIAWCTQKCGPKG
jgi:hypothetical protein